jgi:hypothetical protein
MDTGAFVNMEGKRCKAQSNSSWSDCACLDA